MSSIELFLKLRYILSSKSGWERFVSKKVVHEIKHDLRKMNIKFGELFSYQFS